jgi:hypothetical protein
LPIQCGQAEAHADAGEQFPAHGGHQVRPGHGPLAQIRLHLVRPLVRAAQQPVLLVLGVVGNRFGLRRVVQLLAGIRFALGALGAHPRVAAEMRRVAVVQLQPFLERQVEEALHGVEELRHLVLAGAVAGDLEEADPVGGVAQLVDEDGVERAVLEACSSEV